MTKQFNKKSNTELEVVETNTQTKTKSYNIIELTEQKQHLEKTKADVLLQKQNEENRINALIAEIDEYIVEAQKLGIIVPIE